MRILLIQKKHFFQGLKWQDSQRIFNRSVLSISFGSAFNGLFMFKTLSQDNGGATIISIKITHFVRNSS